MGTNIPVCIEKIKSVGVAAICIHKKRIPFNPHMDFESFEESKINVIRFLLKLH